MAARFGIASAKAASAGHLIAVLVGLVPAMVVAIAVHEAGHALAGRLVNFKLRMYVVGPFMWDKEETGWRFKWNTNVNLFGGMVISLPDTTENLARRFSVYALGGPAVSLFFALFAFGAKVALGAWGVDHATTFGSSILGIFGFFSLLIFIMTAIPFHTGGFYTDGARAIRFLSGGDTARFELLLMKIFSSSSGGVRPRQLNLDELEEAQALAAKLNAPMGVYLLGYRHQLAFDLGEYDEAEKYLIDYMAQVENIPPGIRNAVWLDAAYFYAVARNDLQRAQLYWQRFSPTALLPKAQISATAAAIDLLAGNFPTAAEHIKTALKELPNMIDRGVARALKERLLRMQKQVALPI